MSRNLVNFFTTFLFLILALCPAKSWSAISEYDAVNKNSKVRLISSYQEGSTAKILVGVHFKLKNNWKIYGKSESSFTQPPIFSFTGSSNIDIDNINISWPQATIISEQILDETITYPVYEDEIIIPIEIGANNIADPIAISLKVNYGLCKDICIPVEQNLNLILNSGEIDRKALEIISSNNANNQALPPVKNASSKIKMTLISAILISFIGGLILNIMPCVLPVLSIKLLSVIEHSSSSAKKIRIAYGATIAGILFCFLLFAAILSSLKMFGSAIGWGIQFQNPYFLISLVIILTIFTANLLGLFEINIGNSLTNLINKKIKKNESEDDILHVVITNFLSGILAVLLATPCSAPFVGTAISFAFTQDASIIFTIFGFMGLGLSTPYVILIIAPKSVKMLPRPGNWMITVRNIMAGFLAATIIWLIFVLSHNIGFISSIIVAAFSSIIFFCLRVCAKKGINKSREIAMILFISILMFVVPIKVGEHYEAREKIYDELWIRFDESAIYNYTKQGKVVLVDITADWCITCKFNKKLVLDDKEVIELLKKQVIIGMRGDLTKPNDNLTKFMATHNRYAIPFNIIYGPNAKEGVLLSELLNKKKLLETIEAAK